MTYEPLNILLVDHDESHAKVVQKLFAELPNARHVLAWTPNFDDGLNLAAQKTCDLCLLEYHLGNKTGLDFLKALHQGGSDVPVIIITEKGEHDIDLLAMEAGAYDYLEKGAMDAASLERSIRYANERCKAERNLKKTALELAQTNLKIKSTQAKIIQQEKMAAIGQLAAGVAHEINNPMGFISSNLSTLVKYVERLMTFVEDCMAIRKSRKDDPLFKTLDDRWLVLKMDRVLGDIQPLLSESLEGTERVKKIVQDLKNFSRLDDEGEQSEANINDCINSTINIVWNELKYKVELKKDYGDIPSIKCYPRLLNQVFMNLLVNASHAIEKKGIIAIRTWVEQDHICTSIADTGCGIPESIRERIFEPFFTTKEVGKGTGLGLSIAYDIVKKHKGEISVQSEVGRGTTFMMKIPIRGKNGNEKASTHPVRG